MAKKKFNPYTDVLPTKNKKKPKISLSGYRINEKGEFVCTLPIKEN